MDGLECSSNSKYLPGEFMVPGYQGTRVDCERERQTHRRVLETINDHKRNHTVTKNSGCVPTCVEVIKYPQGDPRHHMLCGGFTVPGILVLLAY